MSTLPLTIHSLGLTHYSSVWQRMQTFTALRGVHTPDQLWLTEHYPVFTQGLAGRAEHLLRQPCPIPVVQSDRGGQITHHGPGQAVIYTLINLNRRHVGVKAWVTQLEQATIDTLADWGVTAVRMDGRPGIYVPNSFGPSNPTTPPAKIAALGLRVRRGCCYHGLAINIDGDLTPFQWINPCGFVQPTTRLIDVLPPSTAATAPPTPTVLSIQQAVAKRLQAFLYQAI